MTKTKTGALPQASLFLCLALGAHGCGSQTPAVPDAGPPATVSMNANDATGSGSNPMETQLTVSNVTSSTFGKLFSRDVDGDTSAQPLVAGALKLPDGTTKNVVYVATAHDSVYAFDADDKAASKPIWHVSVGKAITLPNPYFGRNTSSPSLCMGDVRPVREAGILATPALDLSTFTLYVLALHEDDSNMVPGQTCLGADPTAKNYCLPYTCSRPTIEYRLHALDMRTGVEKSGSPVVVEGSAPGSGAGSKSGTITWDPLVANARASLLLAFGRVYFATASYSDEGDYHGWVFGYDAATLAQTGAFCDTRDGSQGGIWQSGRGLVADGTSVYVVTGNGTFNANTGGHDYGDSVLRLDRAPSDVLDYFSPFLSDYMGQNLLEPVDLDLGSAGAFLIPHTTLLLASGKMGMGYVIDTGKMGKWSPSGDDVAQKVRLTWRSDKTSCTDHVDGSEILSSPIDWQGPDGVHVYVWGADDYVRDYLLDGSGKFSTQGLCFCKAPFPFRFTGVSIDVSDPPCAVAHSIGTEVTSTAAPLSVSSNGTVRGTGILWASRPLTGGANLTPSPGALEAYDATDLSSTIWTSQDDASRDAAGNWSKYTPPTIANGHVYLPTASNQLVVYGLLN